jgi:D-alanyl-D-alanine carboxypeptidase (penicillin-binding protein 5/6)
VKVSLEGKPMAEFPLIALEEVPLASLFGRAVDTVKLWFQSKSMSASGKDSE